MGFTVGENDGVLEGLIDGLMVDKSEGVIDGILEGKVDWA